MNRKKTYDVQIGVPLPLICALFLPVAILLLPLALIGCLVVGIRFRQMVGTLFELIWSLRGTFVQVALNRYSVAIDIS